MLLVKLKKFFFKFGLWSQSLLGSDSRSASWRSSFTTAFVPLSVNLEVISPASQLPWWLGGKESACNAGDTRDVGSIPGSGRSLGGGNVYPFQYSCLENPMYRGVWWAAIPQVAELSRLSN